MTKTKLKYFDIRFKKLLKTKYILVTSLILFVFIIIYGLIFTIGLNKLVNETNIVFIYLFELFIYSIINITLIIYFIWKLYYDDNNDGINKLEMRIGLTKQFMYFYRLLLIMLYTIIFLAGEYILNSIFYAISSRINNLFAFRIFISLFGWLAFISFFTIFISLFFTTIFNSRFIIIFSVIISIIILFISSISGNFISNKIVLDSDNVLVPTAKAKGTEETYWIKEYGLTDNEYVEIGLKFTNYYEFYQIIKDDKKYNFIEFINKIYNPDLSNDENLTKIIEQTNEKYESLNKLLLAISESNPNDEWYEKISKELIKTNDPILVKYGEILMQNKLFAKNFAIFSQRNKNLSDDFYIFIFNTFLYCDKGQELDFILQYQINLLNSFNTKMKKNVYFNPLYNLNLMFFGRGYDFFTDNLNNWKNPLFKQALNITFNIDYKHTNDGKMIIINSSIPKKTIDTSYLVSVNIIIFISISCLLYFSYKIKQ